MGMAASQARFLGLTARKNNVEYEGQQINQQRTALSNKTANYYTDLLGMSVPVPPSVEDYTKTVYTFTDGALTNSISTMIAKGNGLYTISYTSNWVDDFAAVTAPTRSIVTVDSGTYKVGAQEMRKLGDRSSLDALSDTDEYYKTLSADQKTKLIAEENEYITILNEQYGDDSDWYVRYVHNTSSNTWVPYFVKKDVMDNAILDDNKNTLSYIPTYTVGSAERNEEIKGVEARFEQDASGRLISITLKPGEEDQVTYAVSTNTVTDQAKYDDAMNQYEYDKAQYDKKIQEVNAKIAIIQAEDKNLELRLKQLDTEQEAIQTEMDAVQKVIEKNTESTFKTFG